MKKLRTLAILAIAITLLAPAAVTLAQNADPESQDEREVLELSLQEAVELALRNNLSVRVSKFAPELQRESITAARQRFDPTVTLQLPQQFRRSSVQGSTQLSGADVITNETISTAFTFNHTLEYGTTWNLNWNAQRNVTNNAFSSFNPSYNTGLTLNVTQPLLQGFGKEINRAQIIVAQSNLAASQEQFRSQVEQTILQVYLAYWQLVFAGNDLTVAEQSYGLSVQQLERNRVQVEIGTLAPIETIQAEQQVANNQFSVTQARQRLADAEDDLKRLINIDALPSYDWTVGITTSDEPILQASTVDLDAVIQDAFENDPQLRQLRLTQQTRALNVRTARNQLLPNLQFNGSINITGQGGDRLITTGFGSGGVSEIIPGGFSDALQNMLSGDFRNWNVGLSVSFPLNNWAAKAQHAQAVINQRQTATQIEDREQQLRVDLTKAARQVTSGAEQVQQAQTARELAERQLDAEERKFAVGTTTNFEVLTFQNALANARRQELSAITNYMNSLARLEQSKGTLLRSLGVSIGMAGVPGPPQ